MDAYVREYQRHAKEEVEFFQRRRFKEAITYAALCLLPNGKRHPHQYRVPRSALAEGERNLQACSSEIVRCRSFPELHEIVARELRDIYRIGVLTVYDVASRIGAHLNIEPDRVYLHAGTAEGARALGLEYRRESVALDELPLPFQRLRPREAEDCLCIFKDALVSLAAGKP